MVDANTTSAATLQQPDEEVVLHPTTKSLATCPDIAHLSLPTIQHFNLHSTSASLDNMGSQSLDYIDIVIDSLILLTQGPIEQKQQVRQILLKCLDSVNSPLGHTDHQE